MARQHVMSIRLDTDVYAEVLARAGANRQAASDWARRLIERELCELRRIDEIRSGRRLLPFGRSVGNTHAVVELPEDHYAVAN